MLGSEFIDQVGKLHKRNVPFCVVTIVDGKGSIPQIIGASAIFTRDGLLLGTVGGGRIEAKCEDKAVELLGDDEAARTHFVRWNIQKDVGMTCGGEVALYFEIHRPETAWHIVIFGAGHVAQQLCRFLVDLDCHVVCIDPRAEWLDRLPTSERLEACPVEDYSDGIGRIGANSSVLIMTMGHGSDVPILKNIEKHQPAPAFLGLIGSDAKARAIGKELRQAGLAAEYIDRIVCPVGEEIGDNTPPEIAISIISQLLKHR